MVESGSKPRNTRTMRTGAGVLDRIGRMNRMGLHGKKFVMRFYAVRCGQRRRFGKLGRGKTGQDAALEVEKTASGRVSTAYQRNGRVR